MGFFSLKLYTSVDEMAFFCFPLFQGQANTSVTDREFSGLARCAEIRRQNMAFAMTDTVHSDC